MTDEPEADELAQRIQNRAAGRIGKLLAEAQGDVHGKELWKILWGSGVSDDGFVVAVDPSDMKNVCQMGREIPAGASSGSTGGAMGMSALEAICSPGADLIAIWYRLRMLGLCDEAGLLSAYKSDGKFTDAVFQVAATFPMKRMEADVTYQGPPFDTEEFVKQVERASAG
jgi:hypothetical protein